MAGAACFPHPQSARAITVGNLADATLQKGSLTVVLTDENGAKESFEIRPLSMKAGGRIQAFIDNLPPPKAIQKAKEFLADCPGLSTETQQAYLSDAKDEDRAWPPSLLFNPPGALAAVMSHGDGGAFLMSCILEDCRPDLKARNRAFAESVDMPTFHKIIERAMGTAGTDGTVEPGKSDLLILDPRGLEMLSRATLAAVGVDLSPDLVEQAVTAVRGSADKFGTVIRLDVDSGRAIVPKAKGAKSSRSTST